MAAKSSKGSDFTVTSPTPPHLPRSARSDLTDLLGSVPQAVPPVDWAQVEHRLGFSVPPDYRSWAATYPQITIDGFLTVFHPAAPAPNLFTADALLDFDRALRDVDPDDIPYPLHPEPGGLYPWGTTANTHRLHWYPTRGHIVVIGRAGNWEWPGTMSEFLSGILTRQLICPLFPANFPSPGFTTQAYQAR
ncbi:hypothetical protein OHB12_24180 [Nocardia sp. NBC_01730]|uniref:hypothetical protein n=1 Tax=Nocardia sp. NBC_01730 TaxID=2975998 RepID=UPI002E126EDC|nr:hypothetical protein OHB12_24180 [Nocardia sp. NBC_01730]